MLSLLIHETKTTFATREPYDGFLGDSFPSGGANNAPEPPPTSGSVRRTAKVEIQKARPMEALSSELSTQIRKEAQDEPDRN